MSLRPGLHDLIQGSTINNSVNQEGLQDEIVLELTH